ncbi:MAG TPA: biotin transporter BioY [Beijerinckiaceae bacterium]|nr:biotin transporter BioY [Beijerinckiaceae bacterium]
MQATSYAPMIASLVEGRDRSALVRKTVLVLAGTLALALSAKVQVPFYPVPMTMQTLVVLVIGATFGLRLGLATIGLYLLEGFAGLPVFATGAGPAYMAGPTGGYLAGFVAAVGLMGWGASKGYDRSFGGSLALMSVGHLVILALGFLWLSTLIGPDKAFAAGIAPFAWATLFKTLLAAGLVPALWSLIQRYRR